jgi:TRAP-type C4-dicarboxylate transport system permease small subunit
MTIENEKANDTARRIQRSLNVLITTTVLVFLALLGMGVYVYTATRNNTRALCAIKQDAEKRVSESQTFLVTHPQGIPGISASVIQRGIDNAQAQVKALSDVNCKPPTN